MTTNSPNKTGSNETAPSSSALAVSAMSGAAIAGLAINFVTRGKVSHSISTLTKLETSILSQSKEIQKSLQPVATAQEQHLGNIRSDMDYIKNIFTHPKTRGSFGEFQLETLLEDSLYKGKYKFQHPLSNNKRVDCILELPSPLGKIAIDSKFPFDSRLEQQANGVDERESIRKIKDSMTKHINDIASKYIVPGETADYAILFLPSEAFFLKIVDEHRDIILMANRKRVYLACPTTLMAFLTQIHGASRGMALQQKPEEISRQVNKILEDVDNLVKNLDKAEKKLQKSLKDLGTMKIYSTSIRNTKIELEALGYLSATNKK